MKEINKDVCNKIYTMLKIFLSNDKSDIKRASTILAFSGMCATDWDEPELDESLYFDDILNAIKTIN